MNPTTQADLHLHSAYSPDGEWQIGRLISECKNAGLSMVAIADHNMVTGMPEAVQTASELNIILVPAIEVDCRYKDIDLHVLGYKIRWQNNDFKNLETDISGKIRDSFATMIANLHRSGIDVDASEVMVKAAGKLPTGELIAEVLLDNPRYADNRLLDPYRAGGIRSDMPYINFYVDFFAQGKPAYVKIDYMEFTDAISLIKNNGGTPVIAHPGLNLNGSEEIVGDLLQLGAEGLEGFNNYHSEQQIGYFGDIAIQRKVLMTCGSDFHGKTKPLIKPGVFKTLERFEGYVTESVEELLC